MANSLLKDRDALNLIEVVKRLEFGFAEEDVALDPIWEESLCLVTDVTRSGHGEDVVKLLKRSLFRFFDRTVNAETGSESRGHVPGMRKKIMTNATMFKPA